MKGYKSVGFARGRKGMGYDAMPTHGEIREYSKKLANELKYQIEDEHEFSCVVLLKRNSSTSSLSIFFPSRINKKV